MPSRNYFWSYLNASQIVVVLVGFGDFINHWQPLLSCLALSERAQAQRFPLLKLQRNFIIHRAFLRLQLANILSMAVGDIVLKTTSWGKPYIDSRLKFNLSHSENFALYAFSLDSEVGIDIEEERPQMAILDMASLVFAKSELAELMAVTPLKQRAAFFKLWTRKEAVSKAMGLGTHMDFRKLVVGMKAGSISIDNQPDITLTDLSYHPDYFACLAT